jgi:polyisoprenoid-binding protein YceI
MPRLPVLACALAAALAPLAAIPLPAQAPPDAYPLELRLDPARSQVRFRFGATLHSVKGSLPVVSGVLRFDLASGRGTGEVVLDLTNAETGNARRDRKMHAKILETGRFPRAVFHLQRIDGALHRQGTSELQLHGLLDLHGATHRIALPAVARVQGDQVTADGVLTIPYVRWGLADPSIFLLRVGKEVEVQIRAVGRLVG